MHKPSPRIGRCSEPLAWVDFWEFLLLISRMSSSDWPALNFWLLSPPVTVIVFSIVSQCPVEVVLKTLVNCDLLCQLFSRGWLCWAAACSHLFDVSEERARGSSQTLHCDTNAWQTQRKTQSAEGNNSFMEKHRKLFMRINWKLPYQKIHRSHKVKLFHRLQKYSDQCSSQPVIVQNRKRHDKLSYAMHKPLCLWKQQYGSQMQNMLKGSRQNRKVNPQWKHSRGEEGERTPKLLKPLLNDTCMGPPLHWEETELAQFHETYQEPQEK